MNSNSNWLSSIEFECVLNHQFCWRTLTPFCPSQSLQWFRNIGWHFEARVQWPNNKVFVDMNFLCSNWWTTHFLNRITRVENERFVLIISFDSVDEVWVRWGFAAVELVLKLAVIAEKTKMSSIIVNLITHCFFLHSKRISLIKCFKNSC